MKLIPFEIWRDIPGYESLYQVSSMGNVRSLNYNHTGLVKVMHPSIDNRGYKCVLLCKDKKVRMWRVHRLVAITFLPNPDNHKIINHKNEDKTINTVSNIEWCNSSYNNTYGNRIKKVIEANKKNGRSKTVCQYTLDGHLVRIWGSANEVQREIGYSQIYISRVCRGLFKTNVAYGYIWRYSSD